VIEEVVETEAAVITVVEIEAAEEDKNSFR
jgi:hypothetical protein